MNMYQLIEKAEKAGIIAFMEFIGMGCYDIVLKGKGEEHRFHYMTFEEREDAIRRANRSLDIMINQSHEVQ